MMPCCKHGIHEASIGDGFHPTIRIKVCRIEFAGEFPVFPRGDREIAADCRVPGSLIDHSPGYIAFAVNRRDAEMDKQPAQSPAVPDP